MVPRSGSTSCRCMNHTHEILPFYFAMVVSGATIGLWLIGPVCLEQGEATEPTISVDQDKTTVFFCRLSIPTQIYLFVEAEPTVADAAGGGGIMFHVSARYFQSAPSCTTTLR